MQQRYSRLFQFKSLFPMLRISDIRETSEFKTRAGRSRGPYSIFSRRYRPSRGFSNFSRVFVRKSMGSGYLGARTSGGFTLLRYRYPQHGCMDFNWKSPMYQNVHAKLNKGLNSCLLRLTPINFSSGTVSHEYSGQYTLTYLQGIINKTARYSEYTYTSQISYITGNLFTQDLFSSTCFPRFANCLLEWIDCRYRTVVYRY